jgi:serine/threonine protein kinase
MGTSDTNNSENADSVYTSKDTVYPWRELSHYGDIGGRIGKGSYSKVYELGNIYAVKIFREDDNDEITEIAICRKLRGASNIMQVIDVGYKDGKPYMVMPLAESTLTNIIKFDQMTFDDKLLCSYQIAKAVEYIHNLGILHRDIKPDNILVNVIDGDYETKLGDFGLSKDNVHGELRSYNDAYSLYYRAPEVLWEGMYSYPADIWALGCTIGDIFKGGILLNGMAISGNDHPCVIDQSICILGYLGYPNKKECPGIHYWDVVSESPRVKNGVFRKKPFPVSTNIQEFLDRILVYNPSKRMTASEIVRSDLFSPLCSAGTASESMSILDRLIKYQEYAKAYQGIHRDSRNKIIDWIVESCYKFKLSMTTIAHAIHIYDSFISLLPSDTIIGNYQKYAAMCIYIAALFHESNVPIFPYDYESITICNREDFNDAIYQILKGTDFKLYTSTEMDINRAYTCAHEIHNTGLSEFLVLCSYRTSLPFSYSPLSISNACLHMASIINGLSLCVEVESGIIKHFLIELEELEGTPISHMMHDELKSSIQSIIDTYKTLTLT